MFFNKRDKPGIGFIHIAYQLHNPETRCLFVYNLGKVTLKQLTVTIMDGDGKQSQFQTNKISARSNDVIDYGSTPDMNGQMFTGIVTKVIVNAFDSDFTFKLTANSKFELSR